MPHPFTTTGGARLGWTNCGLSKLTATPDMLTISVRLLGTYSFAPDQVSAVERYSMIPFLAWGVQIRHSRADYPQRVIFLSLGSPATVLQGIKEAGFSPSAPSSAVIQPRGFAMRWSAIIIAVAVWNALSKLDFSRASGAPQPELSALLMLGFAFAVSIVTLTSPRLQRLVLKPDRSVNEIRPFLGLLAFISGIMLVIFSIILACAGFNQRA
jgi:hypothetical protein